MAQPAVSKPIEIEVKFNLRVDPGTWIREYGLDPELPLGQLCEDIGQLVSAEGLQQLSGDVRLFGVIPETTHVFVRIGKGSKAVSSEVSREEA